MSHHKKLATQTMFRKFQTVAAVSFIFAVVACKNERLSDTPPQSLPSTPHSRLEQSDIDRKLNVFMKTHTLDTWDQEGAKRMIRQDIVSGKITEDHKTGRVEYR